MANNNAATNSTQVKTMRKSN